MNTNQSHTEIGMLGSYRLLDWWNESFSRTQQEYILQKFKPMSGNGLLEGNFTESSASVINFLITLQTYFTTLQDETISEIILVKADSYIDKCSFILDVHFLYGSLIEHFYKKRHINSKFYELAKAYCKKQINISTQVKEKFLIYYPTIKLPRHHGFEQLAIILEKEKNYKEAKLLCENAERMGWKSDWHKRLNRLKMKLNSK